MECTVYLTKDHPMGNSVAGTAAFEGTWLRLTKGDETFTIPQQHVLFVSAKTRTPRVTAL